MSDKRLTELEYKQILEKANREWPIRIQLAQLAGHKCNAKNTRALYENEFDLTIRELYLEVLFRKPENAQKALELIQEFYK